MRFAHALRAAAGPLLALLAATALASPLIVLDPGHSPDSAGATSIRGTSEVSYNDRFVAELAPALERAGWQVRITRGPKEDRDLVSRPELANRLHATVFLSIHHDSAQLKYLTEIHAGGVTAYETTEPIEGYSLFVSRENPEFTQSLRLATPLGEQLRSLGRAPNLKHAEKIAGENRPLLNRHLGIYEFDHLAVLRHAKVPAVLLEVGVITDRQDEAYVDDAANRRKMIEKIVLGLDEFVDGQGASPARTRPGQPGK